MAVIKKFSKSSVAYRPGVMAKPDYCHNGCPLAKTTNGFVADLVGSNPVIAFMFGTPTKGDVLARKPLTSYGGLLYHTVLKPHRLTLDNVIVSHVLRCDTWKSPNYTYPTGYSRTRAELVCRGYDGLSRDSKGLPTVATSLKSWEPNWFGVTYSLSDARTLEAYQALFMADVEKALRFAKAGFRPLLLGGLEPMEVFAPWFTGTGGVKYHRGDWWEGVLAYTPPVVDVDFKRAEKLVNIETPKTKTRRAPTVQVGLFGEDEEGIAV
jgi:hypothetical protein